MAPLYLIVNVDQHSQLNCLFAYFFVVTILHGNKSHTVGKPVYFLLNVATCVRKRHEKLTKCSLSAKRLIMLLTVAWCRLLDGMIEIKSHSAHVHLAGLVGHVSGFDI